MGDDGLPIEGLSQVKWLGLIIAGDSGTRKVLVRAAELEGLKPLIGSSVEDAYGLLAEHVHLIV
jgi:hypothetical protein